MEIGGLMAYAFKIFLGNPDIILTLVSWAVFVGLTFIVIRMHHDLTGEG